MSRYSYAPSDFRVELHPGLIGEGLNKCLARVDNETRRILISDEVDPRGRLNAIARAIWRATIDHMGSTMSAKDLERRAATLMEAFAMWTERQGGSVAVMMSGDIETPEEVKLNLSEELRGPSASARRYCPAPGCGTPVGPGSIRRHPGIEMVNGRPAARLGWYCESCDKGVVITETLGQSGQPTGDVCEKWRWMDGEELRLHVQALGEHAEVVMA